MSFRSRVFLVLCTIVILCGILAYAVYAESSGSFASVRQVYELKPCTKIEKAEEQTECIFRVLGRELRVEGVEAVFASFTHAYEMFPAFVSAGCHRQVHRLGDMVYYGLYVGREDLEAIDFPEETTACGYGFYHGFMEHLIQDYPRPDFVTQTCEYLSKRLSGQMRDIQMTCYHGSGHGFTLAQSEKTPAHLWGDLRAFTDVPVRQCDALPKATASDIEQCKEGVFNVIVDWMAINQYGFKYDSKRPFTVCDSVALSSRKACYYEMAQKLDNASGRDPLRMEQIVNQISDTDLRLMAFQVGIAGLVQNIIVQHGEEDIITQCATLNESMRKACTQSVVHGLFEHGTPQEEYQRPLEMCALPSIQNTGDQSFCYATTAGYLKRFYTPERSLELCKKFPDDFREACEKKTRTSGQPAV